MRDRIDGRGRDAVLQADTACGCECRKAGACARHDPELRRDVVESHIIGVDGMGIVWGARALGLSVPHRVPGVDLMERLLQVLRCP